MWIGVGPSAGRLVVDPSVAEITLPRQAKLPSIVRWPRPLSRRALVIAEQSYGPDHPEVATALNNLAELLQDTNRLGEAEPLYRREVQILIEFRRRTGHEHPNFRVGRANYVGLLEALGRTPDEIEQQLDELIRPPRSEGP